MMLHKSLRTNSSFVLPSISFLSLRIIIIYICMAAYIRWNDEYVQSFGLNQRGKEYIRMIIQESFVTGTYIYVCIYVIRSFFYHIGDLVNDDKRKKGYLILVLPFLLSFIFVGSSIFFYQCSYIFVVKLSSHKKGLLVQFP